MYIYLYIYYGVLYLLRSVQNKQIKQIETYKTTLVEVKFKI